MKLEKYIDNSKKKRKAILISLGVVVLISVSLLLYKTFASFTESAEFPMMNGKVDYFGNSDIYFAFYHGDEELDEMPQKDNKENLVFDHGECDNGAYVEWDSEEWAPLVKNLSKSKTKCSLYFKKATNAVEYITELAKTDTTNLKTDDTNEANIRFIGSNPNNYIDIGDKNIDGQPILWRIIGVMNKMTNLDNGEHQESLIKIIRNGNIAGHSWDSSPSGINGGWGVNEWSQADIMKLLNPNTVYSGTPAIGGSLYWNRGSGLCYFGTGDATKECNFTNGGMSEEAKNKIAKVRWNTGTANEDYKNNAEKYTAKYIYEGERSNHNGKELCEGIDGGYCNDTVLRITTWDGYVGLVYPSDFGYALGGSNRDMCLEKSISSYDSENCIENNWLKPATRSWTITPLSHLNGAVYAFTVNSSGTISGGTCGDVYEVIPVVYLKSNTKILQNPQPELEYGSPGNPFILKQ